MTVTAKGLEGIIANSTRLSDVNGKAGKLVYAGYDIDEIAGKATFEEIIYLLWHDALPTAGQLSDLKAAFRSERSLPGGLIRFLTTLPKDAAPMDVMRTAISMLGCFDTGFDERMRIDVNRQRALSITAKIGVIAAYFHRARQGLSLPPIRKDLDEAAHFLYLINGEEPSREAARANVNWPIACEGFRTNLMRL